MISKDKQPRDAVFSTSLAPTLQTKILQTTGKAGHALRKRAEAIEQREAALLPDGHNALLSEETHELRVLQIELEMQNEELRRAQVRLEAERERYVDLYELAPVGYTTVSEQGLILEANLKMSILLGVPRVTLHKQLFTRFILKEDQDIYYLFRKRLVETSEPKNCELRLVKDDGTSFWACLECTVVQDESGKPVSLVVLSDITERKRAEGINLEIERRLLESQKFESLGVLAGGIAHDFNNILSIILGHCTLMDKDIDSGIDPKSHVKLIETAATRAADICRQMLTYVGKNSLIRTHLNLRLIVEETVRLLQPTIKNNVGFELGFNGELFDITGDGTQIQQVIMNLCINAAEAIGDMNGTVIISLKKVTVQDNQAEIDFLGKAIQVDDYVCLTVSDNGSGMDVETQMRIFEPFYTTKFTGRGLGMSATLGIIKSHDGSLQLSTTTGVGTTFKVYFPLFTGRGSVAASPKAGLFLAKGGGTILLVDDEKPLLIIGSALLKAMGFTAITAISGREAIEIYRETSSEIDLILLDFIMPEMDGLDTYRILREISPLIPIVLCSGYSVEGFEEDFINDPFTQAVQKPYKPDQLRNIFIKLLVRRS